MKTEAGFTLMELVIAVVLLGILAAVATETYCRRQEQNYRAYALNALRAIWAAEQFWASEHAGEFATVPIPTSWSALGMDSPNRQPDIPVTFDVTAVPLLKTFTATAARDDALPLRQLTINEKSELNESAWPVNARCP